ncbi:hypothetical protein M408DRAFT_29448 [Serendipita vermifera MAFF 305830]|uniref:Uncharacterized protein n=1 Tax=Serendipita vermifera MAFF 305830 TaxID=933852 RepID=A0A0C3ANI7_SERVB|nr:hypothetical protein M408DRAFT_29448 [Serendipita vermifera MAFF 305830]
MCSYLEWFIHVKSPKHEAFTQRVKKEYGPDCGPVSPQQVPTPVAVAVALVASTSAPQLTPVDTTSFSITHQNWTGAAPPLNFIPCARSLPHSYSFPLSKTSLEP